MVFLSLVCAMPMLALSSLCSRAEFQKRSVRGDKPDESCGIVKRGVLMSLLRKLICDLVADHL